MKEILKKNHYYYLTLKVKSKGYTVNLAVESSWKKWMGTHYPEILDSNEWYALQLMIHVPDTATIEKVKIYAYTWANDTSYIDSLRISEYETNPFQDSLPNSLFRELTYELLNELAFHIINVTKENYEDLLGKNELIPVYDKFFIKKKVYLAEYKRRSRHYNVLDDLKQYVDLFSNPSVNTKPRETFEKLLSGYSENVVYTQGEKIKVILLNRIGLKSIQLLTPKSDYSFKKVQDVKIPQGDTLILNTENLSPALYNIQLKDSKTIFNIPIIINSRVYSKVIVLAPVTTWHAYNYYNGKSFYVNTKDDSCVYHISTQRPLVSCLFDSVLAGHDLFIFNNLYNFFYSNYQCNVYPDYYIESHPELFYNAKTIVFAQHCEYFSTAMFKALSEYSISKNIISLGGNQAYYKIQFSDNYKNIECRKDGTFLSYTYKPAGYWRTNFSNEAKYWGNAYTDAGYETYCSYKVKQPTHWIFKNCKLQMDEEFGQYGIDNRGTSGDEMDKMNSNSPSNTILLAKGTNPDNGGGEITIVENAHNAILSFGSIACGSGINKDPVITQMLRNFMNKYSK